MAYGRPTAGGDACSSVIGQSFQGFSPDMNPSLRLVEREEATPIERLNSPWRAFAKLKASGGILLIVCTVSALLWANSRWAGSYFHLWHTRLTIGFAGMRLSKELHFWIN